MAAFAPPLSVSTFTSTFSVQSPETPLCGNRADARGPTMSFGPSGLKAQLAKYDAMAFPVPPKETPPEEVSTIWKEYLADVNAGIVAVREDKTFEDMMNVIRVRARAVLPPGGSPVVSAADSYMAQCVNRQYKATACSTGVYTVRCTEGTTKFQAEDSRTVSLAAQYRVNQKSAISAFADMYDIRRRAIQAAHGCSYEEHLHCTLPASASATVAGRTEALGSCGRVANSDDVAEQYMMRSVERQCKSQAVPFGVYGTACAEGSAKGLAEYRRVAAMSAKFRAGQWSDLAKAQWNYDTKKYARETFGHGCDYEENLFNKYSSMAASMSGVGARY